MATHSYPGPKLGLTGLNIEATGVGSWEVQSSYSIIPASGPPSADGGLTHSFPISSDNYDCYENAQRVISNTNTNINNNTSSHQIMATSGVTYRDGRLIVAPHSGGYQGGSRFNQSLDTPNARQRRVQIGCQVENGFEETPLTFPATKGRAQKRNSVADRAHQIALNGSKNGAGVNRANNHGDYCDNEGDEADNNEDPVSAHYRGFNDVGRKSVKDNLGNMPPKKQQKKTVPSKAVGKKEKLPEAYYCVLPFKAAQFLAYIEYTARKGCIVEGTLGNFYSYDMPTLLKLTDASELENLEQVVVQPVVVNSSRVHRLVWSKKTEDTVVGLYNVTNEGVGPFIVLRKLAFNGLLGRVHRNDAKIVCPKPIANLNVHKNMDHFIHNFPDEATKRRIPCYPAFLYRLLGVDGLRGVLGYTNFIPYMKNILLQTNGVVPSQNAWLDLVNDMWTYYINKNRDDPDALVDGEAVYQFITGFTMYSVVELWDRQHLPRDTPATTAAPAGVLTPQPLLQLDKLGWWCDKHIEQLRRLLQDYVNAGVFVPFRSRITSQSHLAAKYNAALIGKPVHGLSHMLLEINGSAKQTDNDMTYRGKLLSADDTALTASISAPNADTAGGITYADKCIAELLCSNGVARSGFRFKEPAGNSVSVKLPGVSGTEQATPRYIVPGSGRENVAEKRPYHGKKRVKLLTTALSDTKESSTSKVVRSRANSQDEAQQPSPPVDDNGVSKSKRKKGNEKATRNHSTTGQKEATPGAASSSSSTTSTIQQQGLPLSPIRDVPALKQKIQTGSDQEQGDLSPEMPAAVRTRSPSKVASTRLSTENGVLVAQNSADDRHHSDQESDSSASSSTQLTSSDTGRPVEDNDASSSNSSSESESHGDNNVDDGVQVQESATDGEEEEEKEDSGADEKGTTDKKKAAQAQVSLVNNSKKPTIVQSVGDADDSDFPVDDE